MLAAMVAVALLMTRIPSRQAARIAPAEAIACHRRCRRQNSST
jgi:hypothetical protein